MALMKCPECGKEMSSTALSCPHCGAPNKQEQTKEENRKANLLTSTICSILIFCIGVFGDSFGMSTSTRFVAIAGLLVVYIIANKAIKANK